MISFAFPHHEETSPDTLVTIADNFYTAIERAFIKENQ